MADILVLGATGFTGRLITRYLYAHPDRGTKFTFAIGARSKSKLSDLVSELSLDGSVQVIEVDVTKPEQVEAAVTKVKVVINTVGPYIRWGTPVVAACARHGVHYVDLTGETPWVKRIIEKYDYLATRTGAIIIPQSGFDSIPSDAVNYIANKTLKAAAGPDAAIELSTSAFKFRGGVSGGTLSTAFTMMEEGVLGEGRKDFILSPVAGLPSPPPRLLYTLPYFAPTIRGAFFIMAPTNRALVQRTWGLHELEARRTSLQSDNASGPGPESRAEQQRLTYGRQFKYDEFMVMPGSISAVIFGLVVAIGFAALTSLPPVRWLFKKLVTQPGEGPSDETMEKGFFKVTNITSSVPTDTTPRTRVQTIMTARGDPGYLATAVMISESALGLLLNRQSLPALARKGGILTPMSGLGNVLIERLRATGRFEFTSEVVTGERRVEGKKTK